MKNILLLITFIFLFVASAWAEYDIYLKNGSVIKGVVRYEEIDGQIMFPYLGGTVAIPLGDIEKIAESRVKHRAISPAAPSKPQVPQAVPPMETGESPELMQLKQRLSEINSRLEIINKQTAEYDKLKEEYDKVRLRIEVLFQKGITAAKNQNGDPAKWYEFLDGQERQWAQLNTLKKNKLQKELNEIEGKIAPLLQEKQALLAEKQTIEEQIKKLEYPF